MHTNLAQRLLSGAGWALVAKFLGIASGLAVNAILARMLPPDQMGAYFLLTSVVMFAAVVARFGLKQAIVRLVAESMAVGQPGRAGASLRIAYLIVALGVAVVSGGYFFGFGRWLADDVFAIPILATVTGLTSLWIALLAFQTPVAETFRGLHEIRLAVFLDGVLASTLLASVLGVFWLAGLKLDFAHAVLLSLAMVGTSLVIGVLLFLKRAGELAGAGTIRSQEVLVIAGPLFVTNVANQGMTTFSLWVAGVFLVAEEVALYGAAWKLVTLLALPLLLINMSVQPVIAHLYATNQLRSLQNALQGTATLAAVPAVAVLLIFIASAESLLQIVYGEKYGEAALVLIVLSVGQVVNVVVGSCGVVLALTGHQRQLMYVTVLTSFVTISLTVFAASFFGLIGIAYGVTAGLVVKNLIMWLYVHGLTGLWTHATLNPTFLRIAVARVLHRG